MTTTTENRPSMVSDMMDAWMSAYKSAVWSQEQLEQLSSGWMNQARTMRHDGQKVMEVLFSQAKNNADEMARMAESTMHRSMSAVPGWDMATSADLRRQVAELSQRVEELSAAKA